MGVHTYLNNATEDPTPHAAAFMLFRREHWYFFASTGWLDADWRWSPLYEKLAACGRPLGLAVGAPAPVAYTRAYEHCNVSLDCSVPTSCAASIVWEAM